MLGNLLCLILGMALAFLVHLRAKTRAAAHPLATMSLISRLSVWLPGMPSTNLRILVGIALSVVFVIVALVGIVLGRITNDNDNGLYIVGGFILIEMGLDVLQFGTKRVTDAGYASAKQGIPPAVAVDTSGGPVNVQGAPGSPAGAMVKVSVTPAAPGGSEGSGDGS